MKSRLTLGQVFYVSIASLAILLGALFYGLLTGSRRAIVESATSIRDSASERVAKRVEDYLAEAEQTVGVVENEIRSGACDAGKLESLESCLFAAVLGNEHLAEVTLTRATKLGFDARGDIQLEPDRWQLSLFRDSARKDSPICGRHTYLQAGRFVADRRCRADGATLLPAPPWLSSEPEIADPAQHATFSTPASARFSRQLLRTDLSYTELDAMLPPPQRRVVVTVMKTIDDARGEFLGVIRVGLLEEQLDHEVAKIHVNAENDDPYLIFLCDNSGRLVTRLSPEDELQTFGDDLRIVPRRMPREIATAIKLPALQQAAKSGDSAHGEYRIEGRTYLASFRPLSQTQEWNVGIVGPEDYYLKSLRDSVRMLLAGTLVVIAIVLGGGALTLRTIRRGLAQIEREATRMRGFDFASAATDSPFRDVSAVLLGLEQAKTAMRAMGKYVPIDLVRQLYEANREPTLGGRLANVSLMFTDIKDFTTLAEHLPPDRLAQLLGEYFQAMTAPVLETDGTVDKYIGDAVMAIWNAPKPCDDHAVRACRAALACVEATRKLFATPAWGGMPALVTRFGLHTDDVLVGHFGAPNRMSFTAMGDGVNLAARLEGLNKQYGTTLLVSEAVYDKAKTTFAFRRIDRVAVKGRTKGVDVYELLGETEACTAGLAETRTYEQALAAYFARDFAGALALLRARRADGPSDALAERCRRYLLLPPPPDWDGTYVASEK